MHSRKHFHARLLTFTIYRLNQIGIISRRTKKCKEMKKYLILFFSAAALFVSAVQGHACPYSSDSNDSNETGATASPASASFNYRYYENGEDSKATGSRQDIKVFGDRVAGLISVIDKICVRYSETDYSTSIYKPVLYDAMCRIVSHYRKEIRKGHCTGEEVEGDLYRTLFNGYVAIINDNGQLEKAVDETESVDELISLIRDRITVSYM